MKVIIVLFLLLVIGLIYKGLFFPIVFLVLGIIIAKKVSKGKAKKDRDSIFAKQLEYYEKGEQEATAREMWIARRTKELMDSGMLPSEAKIKAEAEYVLK